MSPVDKREIYFSFFMFTADLRPDDTSYTKILIEHLKALTEFGYDGFDMHIASHPANVDHKLEVDSYVRLKKAFDSAGLCAAKFTTNVGTTRSFDPTSPYKEQREQALSYLKSRVDITRVLGGDSIMSGPFLYPYGVFPLTDCGDPLWSDALQEWMKPRYEAAHSLFRELADYASGQHVKLAIEPVKSWETPPPNMVSEVLTFLDSTEAPLCGITIDTAQVVMESQEAIFAKNVARAVQQNRLYYVHISAPDRGAIHDSWIPWDIILDRIEPVYRGPYLVEIFNAIPPFDSSMRMARRRFWRPREDDPSSSRDNAYDIARAALEELRKQIARRATVTNNAMQLPGTSTGGHAMIATEAPAKIQITDPIIIVRQVGRIRIHTFISSFLFNNIANATHIIEGENTLVIVDSQFLAPYARQFRNYADRLGKPIERLYLSHRHPDHWFGLGTAFNDVAIYALPETIDFIKEYGEEQRKDHEARLGDLIPNRIVVPQHVAEQGQDVIDGLQYVFGKVIDTEIDFHLTIKLPEIGTYVVQDLIYSGTHLYLTKDMKHWSQILEEIAASEYELFLPGHGWPCDKVEVGRNLEYLVAARQAIDNGLTHDTFKEFMLQRYPDRKCPGIFDIYLPRLFDGAPDY